MTWLQDHAVAILQLLQKYKAGYLVVVLIAARVTWRIYRAVSSRRAAVRHALLPTQPGQATLGAIQEVVRLLEADPHTDWSTVDLTTLREHLLDLEEVTLRADTKEQALDRGARIEISGTGRALLAIQRLLPAYTDELRRVPGWEAHIETVSDGAVLTVTSAQPDEVVHIRGLGFAGLLATIEARHQRQHLAMARRG
jgi:hypothetical protein